MAEISENMNDAIKPVDGYTVKANTVTSAKRNANEVRVGTIAPSDDVAADSDATPFGLIPNEIYDVLK